MFCQKALKVPRGWENSLPRLCAILGVSIAAAKASAQAQGQATFAASAAGLVSLGDLLFLNAFDVWGMCEAILGISLAFLWAFLKVCFGILGICEVKTRTFAELLFRGKEQLNGT